MYSNLKLDWNDISLVPEIISDISSRTQVNPLTDGKLPLFTAPMDTVIDASNLKDFVDNNINICLPRHVKFKDIDEKYSNDVFFSYGLDEIEEILDNDDVLPKNILIDIANGHMKRLYDTSKRIKEKFGDKINLMIGNIANPNTYRKYCEIGVDYIRVGIGGGSACTTSANASIHYPMASLVNECALISKEFENPTKIIADGGFRNFSDIIKALALGANYVMLGGIFNKCIESCGDNFLKTQRGNYSVIDLETAKDCLKIDKDVYKYYRGMSTKEVQKFWDKKDLRTGEGISKYNKVEYTLSGWCDNFKDYLKSAMSYTNSENLKQFRETEWVKISKNSFDRFNK